MGAYEKIVGLLPQLSDQEIDKLRQHLKALSGFSAPKPKEVAEQPEVSSSTFIEDLLLTIQEVLLNNQAQLVTPKRMKSMTIFNSFSERASLLEAWVVSIAPNKVQRKQFLFTCVSLLYNDLYKNGIPISWDKERKFLKRAKRSVGALELMIFIDRMPAVVNQAFPGYGAKLILDLVIKEKSNHVRPKSDYERLSEK